MEPGAEILRFSDTAILLKHPLMVIGTIVFVLALLSTHYNPDGESPGIVSKLVASTLLLTVCAVAAWLLGSSREVELDPASKRVTQRYFFFKYETAKTQWNFSDFTGVRVQQKTSKEQSATTSPGSGGQQTSIKTTYSSSYTVSLLRADTVATLQDRKVNVPNYPLDLPMETQDNPIPLEALARRLSKLGGWPATRSGYKLVAVASSDGAGAPQTLRTAPHNGEIPIDAE